VVLGVRPRFEASPSLAEQQGMVFRLNRKLKTAYGRKKQTILPVMLKLAVSFWNSCRLLCWNPCPITTRTFGERGQKFPEKNKYH
jgi:hypothetical protein